MVSTWIFVLVAVISCLIGLLIGFIFARRFRRTSRPLGNLYIITSDYDSEDCADLYLELEANPQEIPNHREIILIAKHISQNKQTPL